MKKPPGKEGARIPPTSSSTNEAPKNAAPIVANLELDGRRAFRKPIANRIETTGRTNTGTMTTPGPRFEMKATSKTIHKTPVRIPATGPSHEKRDEPAFVDVNRRLPCLNPPTNARAHEEDVAHRRLITWPCWSFGQPRQRLSARRNEPGSPRNALAVLPSMAWPVSQSSPRSWMRSILEPQRKKSDPRSSGVKWVAADAAAQRPKGFQARRLGRA